MARKSFVLARQPFIVDPESIDRNEGRQVDWNLVDSSYREGAVNIENEGAAAAGAVSLTVEPLPVDINAGTFLKFGTYAPVTVTVNDAEPADAGDVALGVAALSGPIPNGTVLDFSAGVNAQLVRLAADAVAGDTSLTVEALDGVIADATTALFPGGTIQARVITFAAQGATSLVVDELQFAIADEAVAVLGGSGPRSILPGTWMCELSTGKIVPRSIRPASETTIGLLESGASEDDSVSNGTGAFSYGAGMKTGYSVIVGGVVYENLLPESTGTPPLANSTYKTEVQTAGVGTGFSFQQYGDTTS